MVWGLDGILLGLNNFGDYAFDLPGREIRQVVLDPPSTSWENEFYYDLAHSIFVILSRETTS